MYLVGRRERPRHFDKVSISPPSTSTNVTHAQKLAPLSGLLIPGQL